MRQYRRRPLLLRFSLALAGALAFAGLASAHCCHDERELGASQQSEFRSGTHGIGDGENATKRLGEAPDIGRGLGQGATAPNSGGGLGQMREGSLGAYGAGSLGSTGPGGLGAMKSGGLDAPPPRSR